MEAVQVDGVGIKLARVEHCDRRAEKKGLEVFVEYDADALGCIVNETDGLTFMSKDFCCIMGIVVDNQIFYIVLPNITNKDLCCPM